MFCHTALGTQRQAFISSDDHKSLYISAKFNPSLHPALDLQDTVKRSEARQQKRANLD